MEGNTGIIKLPIRQKIKYNLRECDNMRKVFTNKMHQLDRLQRAGSNKIKNTLLLNGKLYSKITAIQIEKQHSPTKEGPSKELLDFKIQEINGTIQGNKMTISQSETQNQRYAERWVVL